MSEEALVSQKKKQKTIMLVIAAVIIVVAAIVAVVIITSGRKERKLKRELSAANTFLAELDYESAISAYKRAIEIDELNVEAYKGLIEAYCAIEDYENAAHTAQLAYEKTANEDFLALYEAIMQIINGSGAGESAEVTPDAPEVESFDYEIHDHSNPISYEKYEGPELAPPLYLYPEITIDYIPEYETIEDSYRNDNSFTRYYRIFEGEVLEDGTRTGSTASYRSEHYNAAGELEQVRITIPTDIEPFDKMEVTFRPDGSIETMNLYIKGSSLVDAFYYGANWDHREENQLCEYSWYEQTKYDWGTCKIRHRYHNDGSLVWIEEGHYYDGRGMEELYIDENGQVINYYDGRN